MSAVANLLTSSNANPVDLVGEWMPGILVRQGKSVNFGSVLLGFFAKLKAERALDGFYNWWERNPVRSNFYSTASATSTQTYLEWQSEGNNPVVSLLAQGSILWNARTGEYVCVAVDPPTNLTTTQVQVIRDFFNTQVTGVAVDADDVWSRVTEGSPEGSAPRRAAYEQPTNLVNYIQTIKSSAFLSNYYDAGQIRTNMEGPKQDAKAYALEQWVNQAEKALLFGQKKAQTATSIQFTGGITNAIDTAITMDSNLANIKLNGNGAAGVAIGDVLDWLNAWMVNGSDAKLLMCGNLAYSALSSYAISAQAGFRIMNGNEGKQIFGLNLIEIQTPYGFASLAMHPLMKNDVNYQSTIVGVDLGLVKLKVMEKLHYQEFEPTNGTDAYQGQFRGKIGLMQQFVGAFGYATNFNKINP
jgi:hypothetical protein